MIPKSYRVAILLFVCGWAGLGAFAQTEAPTTEAPSTEAASTEGASTTSGDEPSTATMSQLVPADEADSAGVAGSGTRLKAREEFQQAEQMAVQRRYDIATTQRILDTLMEQETLRQQELVKAKTKAAKAREKLNDVTKAGVREEVEKWRNEADYWDGRVKAAIVELEKTGSDISETVQSLQSTLKGSGENDLILPGEAVEVFVAEDESLNGPYPVRRGGYIVMPRVGRIALAGKNLANAEKAIKEALEVNQIKNPHVMVERPQGGGGGNDPVIYLSGEFIRPGAWKIPRELSPTLVTTILRSGGLTRSANLTKVRLLRLVSGQAVVEEVNVQAILNGNGLPSDVNLQAGDIVVVPPFANVVYITGNVLKPGTMPLRPDDELTVYSAILRAGGFARFAKRSGVYVLRETGNGAKQKIPIDVRELQAGIRSDIILKSKDIVVVPERFFSF